MICSIKTQQVTYIVPGAEDFDQAIISDFIQKAQDLLVSVRRFYGYNLCIILSNYLVALYRIHQF